MSLAISANASSTCSNVESGLSAISLISCNVIARPSEKVRGIRAPAVAKEETPKEGTPAAAWRSDERETYVTVMVTPVKQDRNQNSYTQVLGSLGLEAARHIEDSVKVLVIQPLGLSVEAGAGFRAGEAGEH